MNQGVRTLVLCYVDLVRWCRFRVDWVSVTKGCSPDGRCLQVEHAW